MASATSPDPEIAVVTDPADIISGFDPVCRAFCDQTRDAIFMGVNRGWDTPEGRRKAAEGMAARLTGVTHNLDNKPNTVFLKATVPDPENGGSPVIAGLAIWAQASVVPGHGDMPPANDGEAIGIAAIYPDDPAQQKLWGDVFGALHAQRWQAVRDAATSSPPALFVLDMCAVDPRFQGRGIGRRFVEWGLAEARARGDLEAVTEASVMGRRLYLKMGFEQQGTEIAYNVDTALVPGGLLPSNVFLRTRKP